MKLLVQEDLRALVTHHSKPCVSIYMPTHKGGQDNQQDPIRLKNLLGKAKDQLIATGTRGPDARSLLEPVGALLGDSGLWRNCGQGLAVFRSAEVFHHYVLHWAVPETVVIGDRFHVKPMIPLMTRGQRFYVLALDLKRTRLYGCTRDSIHELAIADAPAGLEAYLNEYEFQDVVNIHTVTASVGAMSIGVANSHGVTHDDAVRKKYIQQYFTLVDKAVRKTINASRDPLMLAGVKYLCAMYRELSSCPNLIPQEFSGSPQMLMNNRAETFHQALRNIEPYFASQEALAVSRYHELAGSKLASNDLQRIVPASYFGQVKTLLVPLGQQKWGSFDPQTSTVVLHETQQAGCEDMLDFAAACTLMHGGDIYAVPANGHGATAAVFRY